MKDLQEERANRCHTAVTHQLKEHAACCQKFPMKLFSVKRSKTVFVFFVIPAHNVFSCARKKVTSF